MPAASSLVNLAADARGMLKIVEHQTIELEY